MTGGDWRASAHDPHSTHLLIKLADMSPRRAAAATRVTHWLIQRSDMNAWRAAVATRATHWLIQLSEMNARRAAVATRRLCRPAHSHQTRPHTAAWHTHRSHADTRARRRPGPHSASSPSDANGIVWREAMAIGAIRDADSWGKPPRAGD